MRLHTLERLLGRDHGLVCDHVSGTHRVYRSKDGHRRLVVAHHPGHELDAGAVRRIRRELESFQRNAS